MKTTEEIFNLLKEKFGESIIEFKTGVPVEDFIVVNPFEIDKVCTFLRDTDSYQFNNLMNLSGVDDANGKKITDEQGEVKLEGRTFSLFYHLESMSLKQKVTLAVRMPGENPEAASVCEIWRSADWHEREAFDMFGIKFLNHPDLRRILMPYDWEAGYPLRKDYKNPEFYQGMKVPY